MDTQEIERLLAAGTPGPWRLDADHDVVCDEGVIAGAIWPDHGDDWPTWPQRHADAALIAAAPDLAREVLDLRANLAAADALLNETMALVDMPPDMTMETWLVLQEELLPKVAAYRATGATK